MVRDQKGMVLVMVLMILLVLVTLGTAISTFSLTDHKVVSSRQRSLQEYYAARGGAEAAVAYIINETEDFKSVHQYSNYIIATEIPSNASSRCINDYNDYLKNTLFASLSSPQTNDGSDNVLGGLPVTVNVTVNVSGGDYNNALITIESQCRNQTVKVDLTPRTPSSETNPDKRNTLTWDAAYVYWH